MTDSYVVQHLQVCETGGYRPEWWTTSEDWMADSVVDLILFAKFAASKNEARRLIQQGGVKIDGERITDPKAFVAFRFGAKVVLQVGKRRFLRIAFVEKQ